MSVGGGLAQFNLTHGHEPYVVMIFSRISGKHVWSASSWEQAERWTMYWEKRGDIALVVTMQKYLEMQGKSDS